MAPDTPSGAGGTTGAPESPEIDERALIQGCTAGDASAFEPLVEKYRQRVWRLAYQVLHDREEAWDVAQEAFVRAFHSLPSFRGQSAFYTWLFRITVNVATDRHRQRVDHVAVMNQGLLQLESGVGDGIQVEPGVDVGARETRDHGLGGGHRGSTRQR